VPTRPWIPLPDPVCWRRRRSADTILSMALLCGYLREAFDPLQGEVGPDNCICLRIESVLWVAGSTTLVVAASACATASSSRS